MLKTTKLTKILLLPSMAEDVEIGSGWGNCEDKTTKRSLSASQYLDKAISYLTTKARVAFSQLKKTFTKVLILWHFDLEC